MRENPETLIQLYFDGMLSESQANALNLWIKKEPEHALKFAEIARLHDGLRNVVKLDKDASSARIAKNIPVNRNRYLSISLAGLIAFAAAILLVVLFSSSAPVIAATELDRLIEKSVRTGDRTYRIHNLDETPEEFDERQPPIDGALLYVRHPDLYVLERRFPDGRVVLTGSDGERSWRVPPDRVVRVSRDPMRFRGPVPGNQHGIAFANLRSDLVQLRDAYNLSPLKPDASGDQGLLAVKKSTDYRGPNEIELWYHKSSGVIRRMVFSGMPKARGGPDRVSVELIEQRDLGEIFFRHESHHDADRRVVEED